MFKLSRSSRVPTLLCEQFFAALVPFYQCDVNGILEFGGQIDLPRLETAFLAALAREPIWAHRFVPAAWRAYWERIPRSDRPSLLSVIMTDDPSAEINRILRQSIDAAARLYVLRGPSADRLFFQLDHRLTDATGARLFIESVRSRYVAQDEIPTEDGPLVRPSIFDIPPVFTPEQKKKALTQFQQQTREFQRAPRPFSMPARTPEDPVDLAEVLEFPDGFLEQLRSRAVLDYGTPTLAVLAATYLALKETVGIAPKAAMQHRLLVDLRRYLPPDKQPAPSSIFIGGVDLKVEEPGADTMAQVMQQLWKELARHRGPHFGLIPTGFLRDLPIFYFLIRWIPFALLKWVNHWRLRNLTRPIVYLSDLTKLGSPGDRWGDTELMDAYFALGLWGIPGDINIFTGSFGNKFRIIIGTGPRSFARKLAAAMDRHLRAYVQNASNNP